MHVFPQFIRYCQNNFFLCWYNSIIVFLLWVLYCRLAMCPFEGLGGVFFILIWNILKTITSQMNKTWLMFDFPVVLLSIVLSFQVLLILLLPFNILLFSQYNFLCVGWWYKIQLTFQKICCKLTGAITQCYCFQCNCFNYHTIDFIHTKLACSNSESLYCIQIMK